MRTCCPICGTVFRITPEQLRIKAGKVRCGQCHSIFNALESLIEELPAAAPPQPVVPPAPPEPEVAPEAREEAPPPLPEESPAAVEDETPVEETALASLPPVEQPEPEESVETPAEATVETPEPESAPETPEESTQAAREAGLVALREMSESPAYNRWAAGTLAANPLGGLESDSPRRIRWPFVAAAVVLALVLAGQVAHYFRTELVQRLPAARGLFDAVGVDVPLPQLADLVSIEASDLQADNARGLLILSATLKNRAPHPQAWPVLELTLTDAQDGVVARRVLHSADYLPPKADATAFAANGEAALKLWVEAKDLGAVGYRLYVFYP